MKNRMMPLCYVMCIGKMSDRCCQSHRTLGSFKSIPSCQHAPVLQFWNAAMYIFCVDTSSLLGCRPTAIRTGSPYGVLVAASVRQDAIL